LVNQIQIQAQPAIPSNSIFVIRQSRVIQARHINQRELTMKHFVHLTKVGVISLLLVLAACASTPPPIDNIALAKSAIANAVSAGGNEFAAVEMRTAQEKMEMANRAMTKQEYDQAKIYATEAEVDARLAEKKAQSAKAQKAAATTQEANRVLREEINRKSPQ
jgi:hypothetical protein